nr:uncharacterized protein LOC112028541 [Quercus suber]
MQCEINKLKRELRHERRKRRSHHFRQSSEESVDTSYRQRSRTPPSESFSYDEEHHCRQGDKSPPRRGLGNDALNKALSQVLKSPFTRHIEDADLPRRIHQPTFTIYNGRTDPVEHVSHYSQRMVVHAKDKALMCKVFSSSLGPVVMRWFNGLRANFIGSFEKLTQAFGARFITCRRGSQPLGSLLSMSMHEGETLKSYSDRYWEMFNEVDGAYDDVAINTFTAGLPTEHDLRKSLTGKPVISVRQLMDWINKYKRVEEDQIQGRGKSKVIPQEMRDFRSDWYNNNRPRKDFGGQSRSTNSQVVNAVFRKPVQRVLEKIKDESFFRWPNKMARDSAKRNRNLYCQYHQDYGHTTKDCRNLWDHLDQLVREGKLTQLLYHSSGRRSQAGSTFRGDASSGPPRYDTRCIRYPG